MADRTIEISLPEDKADLLQAASDIQGKSISDMIAEGQSVDGIVNDQLIQATYRLKAKGAIPTEIIAEAKDFAAVVVAGRKAVEA